MKKEIFGANLKMMNPVPRTGSSFSELERLMKDYNRNRITSNNDRDVVVFAPFTHLDHLADLMTKLEVKLTLGAQDVSEHILGAHTSEISPVWLRELRIKYVLIGHSEVRTHYEDLARLMTGIDDFLYPKYIDLMFNRKIRNAFEQGLKVIYCVGETEQEKDEGRTNSVIERQIRSGIRNLDTKKLEESLIIAYEPRWSIGGNKPTSTLEEIYRVNYMIRSNAGYEKHPNPDNLPVLYGGSMNPANAKWIMAIPGVNGGLIGSACLDAEKFRRIVDYKTA